MSKPASEGPPACIPFLTAAVLSVLAKPGAAPARVRRLISATKFEPGLPSPLPSSKSPEIPRTPVRVVAEALIPRNQVVVNGGVLKRFETEPDPRVPELRRPVGVGPDLVIRE
jgi:hypothetical protein